MLLVISVAGFACDVTDASDELAASDVDALAAHDNPMMSAPCADPGVLHDGGKFYVTCTGVDGEGAFPIYESADLTKRADWHRVASIFPRSAPVCNLNGHCKPGPVVHPWAHGNFWAPEIHHVGDRYLAVYASTGPTGKMAVGIAQSDSPIGPFVPDNKPIVESDVGMIDPHVFVDPKSKKTFLYWKRDQDWQDTSIYARQLEVSEASDGHPVQFAAHSQRHTVFNFGEGWEHKLVEAPWVIYRDGWYYLFYSGGMYCDSTYGVGVARSRSPTEKFERVGATGEVLGSGKHWQGPGHVSVVNGPGGDWLAYHAYPIENGIYPHCGDPDSAQHPHDADDVSPPREVRVDPIVWKNGVPHIVAHL